MASGTSDGLILVNQLGATDPNFNQNKDVSGSYTRAKCTGGNSLFTIYDQTNFAANSMCMIVESTSEVDMGKNIRSFQGYDKNGIILYPHPNFCGQAVLYTQADPDITDQFPTGQAGGVSAFIVCKGRWALYSEKNYRGVKIQADGKSEFGPGDRITFGGMDAVQSIKQL